MRGESLRAQILALVHAGTRFEEARDGDAPSAQLHQPSRWHGRMVIVLESFGAAPWNVRGLVEGKVPLDGAPRLGPKSAELTILD